MRREESSNFLAFLSSLFIFLFVRDVQARKLQQIQCSTSCGDIKNIKYPFRLKGDPAGCGDPDFELSCSQSNKTILEFHSGKYYVSNISYYDRIITVVDVNLDSGSCGLPQKSLLIYDIYGYNYTTGNYDHYTTGNYDHFTNAVFVNCSSKISDPTYRSLPCLNNGNQSYVYVSYDGNNSIYNFPDSCLINSKFLIRKASADDNPSYETIQKLLQSGFDLKWSVGCKDCGSAGGYCDRDQDKCIKIDEKSKTWIWALTAVAATIGIAIILVILFLLFMRWRRAHFEEKFLLELMNEAKEIEIEGKKGFKLKVYSVSSIRDATNCFSDENKLGEGGYGSVYKGLFDGQEIAIKRLSRSSRQGLAEFKNELIIVAKLQHTNLVQLLGFCIQGEEKMLVYEFMPHNSLDSYIFDQSKRKLFNWNKYFNIIKEIAQGILYLHKYSRLRIIHRDLKAGNILLDNNMNPKIADFGMATIFTTAQSEANTNRIVGTRGYMAPEYAVMGIFSTNSDVFSYGVLVLEIVSGRRSNSNFNFDRPLNLIGYAWMLWKEDAALELMHPTLRDSCSEDRVLRYINVALLCVEDNPLDRPSMADVISMLTSEFVELKMPKQPAFCIERRVAEVNSSTEGMAENHTINNLTVSIMTGR